MNQKIVIIFLVLFGTLGIISIWNIRYQSGYDSGIIDGTKEGNQTGFVNGVNLGTETGYSEGYSDGIELGKEIGKNTGYATGYNIGIQDGEEDGHSIGFKEGEAIGLTEGYQFGLEYGSKSSTLRDPTKDEALIFIETDNTDVLFAQNNSLSIAFILTRIRQNAANQGFKCIWVQVEMYSQDRYFCAFNTTDSGMLYFYPYHDHIHDIEIGKACFDERYTEPEYDDTVTKIIYIS